VVFSTHHPAEDWRWFQRPDYFATEEIVDRFPLGDGTAEVRFYRRPLSAIFAAIRESGFQVDELAEPMPLQECAERHPDSYALLTTTPRFLYFRLRPEASTARLLRARATRPATADRPFAQPSRAFHQLPGRLLFCITWAGSWHARSA